MLLIHYCQIILLSPDASHFINENGEFPDLSTSTLRLYITKSKHFCAAHFAAPLPLNTTCIWREACLVLEPWQDAPISFTSSVQLAVGKRNQKRRFAAACWRMPMLMSNCSDLTSPQNHHKSTWWPIRKLHESFWTPKAQIVCLFVELRVISVPRPCSDIW